MVARIWEEMEVKVPASEAWKLYGSLFLAKVVVEALPDRFSKFEVIEGDGSAGTILHIFLAPGCGRGDREGGKKEECIVRGTIEYEVKEEAAANAALVSIEPLRALMHAAADYLTRKYNTNNV
ncbi:UNVERIFIED_CONTAM: hypothetical protein Scaly_0541200 [Sesamum calycinum]|uniref:Bet v I/Major latex protein domain-containing protein n=1 Tax=Sesamum calycinum TaxID=2727403 RepID=A0AAW2RR22_9LAMI